MSTRLSATELAVAYGSRPVLHGLDVEVPDGEMTVIVGPNACGKSTLLRALARMVPATAGQVTLDGRPVSAYAGKELARRVGLLPQSPPHRTA